jgi:hypothetical protein
MASKITPEQQADLNAHSGQPVPVQGDGGDVVCFMVDATAFLHMQGIFSTASRPSAFLLRIGKHVPIGSPNRFIED